MHSAVEQIAVLVVEPVYNHPADELVGVAVVLGEKLDYAPPCC
ncbi:hypothetical protein [Shewanella sp. UCD-KL12]|nr:hypothetical protein [Shewanella sp. UCD-KL12]